MNVPIVKVTNLHKYFDRLHVLKGVNIEVQPREVICVIGRSGSGKSTMLRCINFLEEPSAGEIEIHGLADRHGLSGIQPVPAHECARKRHGSARHS